MSTKKDLTLFRVYKSASGRMRNDGSATVRSYGCNGHHHVVITDRIWYNNGQACGGKSQEKPTKVIGRCDHKTCQDHGFFTFNMSPADVNNLNK